MTESPPSPQKEEKARYERRDVDALMLILVIVLLVITGVVVEIATAGLISF